MSGRDERDLRSAIPASKADERVGADEDEKLRGRKLSLQSLEGVYGVIRLTSWIRSVYERDGKIRKAVDGEFGHGDAVFEAGRGAERLQGLNSDRGKEHSVELEGSLRGTGDANVPEMRGVETATEKGNSPFAHRGLDHLFMLEQSRCFFTGRFECRRAMLPGSARAVMASLHQV